MAMCLFKIRVLNFISDNKILLQLIADQMQFLKAHCC